ncbi:MAG TPA: SDR family NAD(P)-dependent oxidoreductase [Xanthomonadaceae bacterium]|nr:SDR family NAD(P)-dependent oxidoreductase [Xanthomonadaceae bacterium]
MDRVKDKTCVVTGAALGIGHACVVRLAEEGAKVALFDLHDAEGEALAAGLQARGFDAGYWHVDVSDEPGVKRAIDEVAAR